MAQRKKVMLLTPMLHQGGFERVCVRTAQLLAPYYDVTVVLFDDADIAYDVEGLKLININCPSRSGRAGKLLNLWRRVRKVKALKRRLGTEVTYSFGQTANLVNSYARVHDRTICSIRSYLDLDNPEKIRIFCRRADEIACCSAQIEREIREKYGCGRTFTLYNPIRLPEKQNGGAADTSLPEQPAAESCAAAKAGEALQAGAAQTGAADFGLPPERAAALAAFLERHPATVMSMGREDDVKGFWHLLKAFAAMERLCRDGGAAETLPRRGLVVIGDGSFAEYRALAAALGIGEDVFFTGVSRRPSAILENAALYALTSIHEGFPNALLEAMALGVPVIAADCTTGPREILAPQEASAAEKTGGNAADSTAAARGYKIAANSATAVNAAVKSARDCAYGILLPPFSPEKNLDAAVCTDEERALAREMMRLLSDEELRRHYGQAAARRARDFSEEAYVEQCRARFG